MGKWRDQERGERYSPPLPKRLKGRCIGGNDYQIYEIGRDHILISKNGHLHIKFSSRPNGCLCYYLWENHRWTPKCKYESVPYESVLDEDKILNFMYNNKQTL